MGWWVGLQLRTRANVSLFFIPVSYGLTITVNNQAADDWKMAALLESITNEWCNKSMTFI